MADEPAIMLPRKLAVGDFRFPQIARQVDAAGKRIQVLVNGEEVPSVVSYDVEAGKVVAHWLDDEGKPMVNPERTKIMANTYVGKVEVGLVPK